MTQVTVLCTRCHLAPRTIKSYCGSCSRAMKRESEQRLRANRAKLACQPVSAKECTLCCKVKPASDYYVNSSMRGGLASRCKQCEGTYLSAYRREQRAQLAPEQRQVIDRTNHLSSKYGISPETYDEMLAAQDGKCAICGSLVSKDKRERRMPVDHDHVARVNRGILCMTCNLGIGLFGDDPNRLLSAAAYLMKYTQQELR